VLYEIKNRLRHRYRGNPDELPDNARDIYREPADPDWAEAWHVTECLIRMVRDEVAANGAKFLLTVLDNPIQVNPDVKVREDYAKRLGVDTLFYPDYRLESFAQTENIPALILAPLLAKFATKQKVFFHGFGSVAAGDSINDFSKSLGRGHWNEQGHAVVGKMIADKLCHDVLPSSHEQSLRLPQA
jgi:hypothetical protein